MSYPPGPPQPGPPQPGQPYGQQPPFGQQGYQPYGQQPGYPQYPGHPQQPGPGAPFGPQGGPGGFGEPPKKSKTGLWVGLSIGVVVLLGAFAVTGFLAPGFLVSDDEETSAAGAASGGGGPEQVAQAIVDGINNKDKAALNGLTCPNATPTVKQIIGVIDQAQGATLSGPGKWVSPTEYTATVQVTNARGSTAPFSGTLSKQGERWCWQNMGMAGAPGSTGSTGGPGSDSSDSSSSSSPSSSAGSTGGGTNPQAVALIQDFVAKVNAGDVPGASALACPADREQITSDVQSAVAENANITAEVNPGSGGYVNGSISGTLGGEEATGLFGVEESTSGSGWCVTIFGVY